MINTASIMPEGLTALKGITTLEQLSVGDEVILYLTASGMPTRDKLYVQKIDCDTVYFDYEPPKKKTYPFAIQKEAKDIVVVKLGD